MKVKVIEHSSEEHVTEVKTFDALKLHNEIKAAQNSETSEHTVIIGDVIIDSRSIKAVVPVK